MLPETDSATTSRRITERALEETALRWFEETGWRVAHGPDLGPEGATPERDGLRQVVLPGRLAAALRRLNPTTPAAVLEEVAQRVTVAQHPVAIVANRILHEWLTDGVPVEVPNADGEVRGDRVWLVDLNEVANNDWLIVSQLYVRGLSATPCIPDLVAYLNGLPIAVVELKNPADAEADVWKAYSQIQTYREEIPDLFLTNAVVVVSDGLNAYVGATTADADRMLPWRTVRDERDRPRVTFELETVVRGFFDQKLLLDYLRHFILFEPVTDAPGGLVKKVAAYHQFHAVRTAVEATIRAAGADTPSLTEVYEPPIADWGQRVERGSRKGGIVWHTQGSGKSITMACFAGKLRQQARMKNPTLVVITDRNDLDEQLYQQFVRAQGVLKEKPEKADSRAHLRALLLNRGQGGVFFTTIQKFGAEAGSDTAALLTDRANVVVIADEAHRSQYGFEARFADVKDADTGAVTDKRLTYGFAKYLRDALPNATFVGFTGTPLETDDRSTRQVFGEYVSIYDIQDAVRDKATVPIMFESRLARLSLTPDEEEIASLNQRVDEVLEDEEDTVRRENKKATWTRLENLVGAGPRLKQVAADILRHYDERDDVFWVGKAMIVGMSRRICVDLYDELVRQRPEWASGDDPATGALKVVMTGSAADGPAFQKHLHGASARKLLERRFKDPADPLRVVIVRDMWLTGFDVPCLHTLYVDKPMRGHSLMQAIARVNRVFGNKTGGLVVDYIGLAAELKRALGDYIQSGGKVSPDGTGQPATDAAEALKILLGHLNAARGILSKFNYKDFRTRALWLLPDAADYLLGLPELPDYQPRKQFLDHVAAITRGFSLCGTLPDAEAVRDEVAFLQAIRVAITKATTTSAGPSEAGKQQVVKQLIDSAVIGDGVEDIFKLAGLPERANLSILSDEFLADVLAMKQQNLAAELLHKLLHDEVKARSRTNVVQEQKFSKRLEEAIRRYRARAIDSAQVIAELIEVAKAFRADLERGASLNLTNDEIAFYDALADHPGAEEALGMPGLREIAQELVKKLRANASVDWQQRESVRARLRNLVRVALRRYGYPPDQQPAAIEMVMQQAERLTDGWTS